MRKITEYLETLDTTSKTKAELLYNSELELHSKSEKLLEISGENDVARRRYRPLVVALCFGLLLIPALSEKGFNNTIITVSAIILFLIPTFIALKTMVFPKSFREEFRLSKEVHRRRKNILKIVNNNWEDPIWQEVKEIVYGGGLHPLFLFILFFSQDLKKTTERLHFKERGDHTSAHFVRSYNSDYPTRLLHTKFFKGIRRFGRVANVIGHSPSKNEK